MIFYDIPELSIFCIQKIDGFDHLMKEKIRNDGRSDGFWKTYMGSVGKELLISR